MQLTLDQITARLMRISIKLDYWKAYRRLRQGSMQHSKHAINYSFTNKQTKIMIGYFNNRVSYGLYATVIENSVSKSQITEVWKYHLNKPLFFIMPLQNDAVKVYDVLRGTYKSSTIQAALEAILSAEGIPADTVSVSNAQPPMHPAPARNSA